jgi:hypothetical protein
VFDKYHADPAVSRTLGNYLVVVHIDIAKNPGGKELYEKYGTQRGVPAWTILDADEKVLADSGDGKDNVGFPFEPNEVAYYFKVLKKTCPKLTDKDVELLTEKLKEVGPKK